MRALSALQQTDIEVDSFYEGCDLRIRLSRARFDDMCSALYRRLTESIKVRQNPPRPSKTLSDSHPARAFTRLH